MTTPSAPASHYRTLAGPGNCHMCFKTTDSPIITLWNAEINEKIKICSDECLGKYNTAESNYRDKAALLKQKRMMKIDLSGIKEPAPKDEAEKKKEVDEGDIVLEDI